MFHLQVYQRETLCSTAFSLGAEDWYRHHIYNVLSEKYHWRHWLVVVYTDMQGADKHWRRVCSATTGRGLLHWKGRYNIMVGSVPDDAPIRKWSGQVKKHGQGRQKRIRDKTTRKWKTVTELTPLNAREMYEQLPLDATNCATYPLVGVVLDKVINTKVNRFFVRAPESRLFHTVINTFRWPCSYPYPREWCDHKSYNVFVLG